MDAVAGTARMEEPVETVRYIIEETVRRGTVRTEDPIVRVTTEITTMEIVRTITGETVRRGIVRTEDPIVRALTGITITEIVQTITVETVRRETARMEDRAEIARVVTITADAGTDHREDVPADRAEGIRLDVR